MVDISDKPRIGTRAFGARRAALLSIALCGCVADFAFADVTTESPFCALSPDPQKPWLPNTPLPDDVAPPAPRGLPPGTSDCQFYRPAWQRFLVATQPVGGVPAFLTYDSFPNMFRRNSSVHQTRTVNSMLELNPRSIQRPNEPNTAVQELLDKTQAGVSGTQGGYLIDQNGRFVFYAIHVNPAYSQFLKYNGLDTLSGIQSIQTSDPNFTFLGEDVDIASGAANNIVEYKSAWMVVDTAHPPANYIVAEAKVPHYIVSGKTLVQKSVNGNPIFDTKKVALLALHVVFTLPGHPEMIWSTFEHVHVDRSGIAVRDNAPPAKGNIDDPDMAPDEEVSGAPYPLYKAHTHYKDANKPIFDLGTILANWDEATQSFSRGGAIIQTSVYRPYPGSKTDGTKAGDSSEDDEVIAINNNATAMFAEAVSRGLLKKDDARPYYRLVGATWLDQPKSSFLVNKEFEITPKQTTDDTNELVAGEGRLGSTAMESFTESERLAPSCFDCHNTRHVVNGRQLLAPTRLNVSHVLSKFVDTQLPPPPPR